MAKDIIKEFKLDLKDVNDPGRIIILAIIDAYANDPLGTYFLIKDSIDIVNSPYDSFGLISTDVAVGEAPRVLQTSPKSPL